MTDDTTSDFQPTVLNKRTGEDGCLGCGHPVITRTPEAGHQAMLDHMDWYHNEQLVDKMFEHLLPGDYVEDVPEFPEEPEED